MSEPLGSPLIDPSAPPPGGEEGSPFPAPLPANAPWIQKHFGTDMQVGSWCFLISAVEYFVLAVLMIFVEETVTNWSSLIGSIMFVIGSVYFLYVSYPEVMMEMFKVTPEDVEKMSWTEKYFTGNHFLKATWFFLLACTPYIYDAVYIIIIEPTSAVGYAYLFGVLVSISGIFVWVYSCMPKNMLANGMQGSSFLYEKVLSKCCCCCMYTWKRHAGTDFLAGAWFFTILAAGFFLLGLAYVFYAPTYYLSWIFFTDGIGFLAGSYLFVLTSYPENMLTTYVYDRMLKHLCCIKDVAGDIPAPHAAGSQA